MKILDYLKLNSWLLIILVIAAILRFYQLDFQSLWDDEISSMLVADPNLSFKEARFLYDNYDNMPPLYFVVLRLMFVVFGYTSFVLRSFSVLLGVAGVYAIYLLGKELINKKVGLYAALLLCLNYFHIYYSQEARPYTFLVFSVTLSFFYLVRFIKSPSRKHAVYYGLAALLMIYSQYIAISVLLSQALVLLYFLIFKNKQNRLGFLYQLLLSGGVIALGYIPAYLQLIKNYKITSSWIPAPTLDIYTQIFYGFFGNSELVIPVIYILILLYFVFISKESDNPEETQQNPAVLSFILIISWLVVVMMIFLIRSYLTMPIIVPRYLNLILPAVLLMAAIGLGSMKQMSVRVIMGGVLIIFQLTDLVVIKKYYSQYTKPQYREAASFISSKRKAEEPVVAKVGWHYKLFFNYQQNEVPFYWMDLNTYVSEMMKDSTKLKSFWYAGVHESVNSLEEKNRLFLNEYFFSTTKADYFETNAHYFERKKISDVLLDNRRFTPALANGDNVLFMDGSTGISYPAFLLPKGDYSVIISSKSTPEKPINNVNARYQLKINNTVIGQRFAQSSTFFSPATLSYNQLNDTLINIEINFNNDTMSNGADRNLFIHTICFRKK